MAISVPRNPATSAQEIKTLYESNLDTNAFSDSEQTKVSDSAAQVDLDTVESLALAGL